MHTHALIRFTNRMARFGEAVYVAGDVMLLNQNMYDKNAKKKKANVFDLKGSKNHVILGLEIKDLQK